MLGMGRIGELMLIVLLILILFGAGKLPKVMGDLAKGLRAFRNNLSQSTDNNNNNHKKRRNKWNHSSSNIQKNSYFKKPDREKILPIDGLIKAKKLKANANSGYSAGDSSRPHHKLYKFKGGNLRD